MLKFLGEEEIWICEEDDVILLLSTSKQFLGLLALSTLIIPHGEAAATEEVAIAGELHLDASWMMFLCEIRILGKTLHWFLTWSSTVMFGKTAKLLLFLISPAPEKLAGRLRRGSVILTNGSPKGFIWELATEGKSTWKSEVGGGDKLLGDGPSGGPGDDVMCPDLIPRTTSVRSPWKLSMSEDSKTLHIICLWRVCMCVFFCICDI